MSDTDRIRIQEIQARLARLSETKRWIDGELKQAQQTLSALESGKRSVEEESRRLSDEHDRLQGWTN